jgi:adenylosuccinate synthase
MLYTFLINHHQEHVMPLDIIIGTQWGDEGKGRIVDLLAANAAIVARFNGGDNAGHTVTAGDRTFKLHLIPSGMIHPHTLGVIGSGLVVNPASLLAEMAMLRDAGVEVDPQRMRISYAAHLITPGHKALDQAQEVARGGEQIGTTGRGIGPAYTDKAARTGLRVYDMLDPAAFEEKVRRHLIDVNHRLQALFGAAALDEKQLAAEYRQYAETLKDYIGDAGAWIADALAAGQRVLAEGAQGTLLDLDAGTYPFVTSSYPTASGALTGLGIGIVPVGRVIGVTKAFQTRVGAGPFPTELEGEAALRLRGTGANPWDEYGTTTGRARRVGWFDGVLLRYAMSVNGLTELAVTKLDVMSGLKTIRVCTAYRRGGQTYERLPYGPADLEGFEPVYEELPGWEEDVQGARRPADLPEAARAYLLKLEQIAGAPVRLASVGAEREQVVQIA